MRKNYTMPCAYGVSFTVNENIAASGMVGVENAIPGLGQLPTEIVNGKKQVYVTDKNGYKIYADDEAGLIVAVREYVNNDYAAFMEIMGAWAPLIIMGGF